jgi:MFS family permease
MWLAILVSHIGTWIHDVAAAWLMAELTSAPLWVAAVQAATTLPVVLLAIIAGTLSDIVDRRRYLIAAQLWMIGVASLLALLAGLDLLAPWSLLVLTFALGAGAAMALPAQSATTPELVPRAELTAAVALGSLGVNLGRAIGPALGGLVLASLGTAWAFGLNALSFLALVIVLWRWRREVPASTLPPEPFGTALGAGLRYARESSVFQAVLVRAAAFFVFGSALTALLPLVVRADLGGGATTYGAMLTGIGLGAIGGALLLPRLQRLLNRDQLVLCATLAYAVVMAIVPRLRDVVALFPTMLLAGAAWIAVLSSLQVAAQTAVPQWVRARALALYIVVFSGGMALGSMLWGAVAQATSNATALSAAAAGAVLAALFVRTFRLSEAGQADLQPSNHWAPPPGGDAVGADRGPVLVTIEYEIAEADREEFFHRMRALGRTRRRDGALQWGLVEDTERPGVHLEYFLTPSWVAHLRQHERVTADDRQLQDAVARLHRGGGRPRVRHFAGHAREAGP